MSGKITGMVWDLDLPHSQAWLFMSLCDHAEHDGSKVYPGTAVTAWKTGYSGKQVKRIISALLSLEHPLLEVVDRGGGGKPAEYRICIENFEHHKKGDKPVRGRPRKTGDMDLPEKTGDKMSPGTSGAKNGGHPHAGAGKRQVVEPSVSEEGTSPSSGDTADKPGGAPSKAEISKQTKAECGRELMERVSAKREGGANINSPTNDERKQFAKFYDQARLDGHDRDTRLLALDYQVTKAAGEIEGEPKAWCGYRTALDRVNEGWIPEQAANAQTELEKKRLEKENAEIDEMAREAARLMQQEFGHG